MRYISLLFVIILASCQRDQDIIPEKEPPPAAQNHGKLSVVVYDATEWTPARPKGIPATAITVYLFQSQADFAATWQHPDNPKYAFKAVTGSNGTAIFDSVPPGKYYISTQDMVDGSNTFYFQSEFRKELRSDGLLWGLTSDTLIQATTAISSAQPYAFAGAFLWKDLNGDGVINNMDFQPLPQRSITIEKQANNSIQLIMGVDGEPYYQQLSAVLNGAYKTLSNFEEKQVMADGYMSHNALPPIGEWVAFSNFSFNSNTPIINNLWSLPWQTIRACNQIINESRGNLPLNISYYTQQARLLRALAYLELTNRFGDVPLMTENDLNVFYPSQSPVADVIDYVRQDLSGLIDALPDTASSNIYLNKWSGLTILAKLHLSRKDYASALQCINAIISRQKYLLSGSLNEVYQNTTNKEILWRGTPDPTPAFTSYFLNRPVFPSIRYAEVLLLSAEANIGAGNFNEAQNMLNQLQSRSKRAALTLTTSNALDQLNMVIKQEAPLEGFHFATLVRLQLAEKELKTYGYKFHNQLLPIPLTELIINPNIRQNPGY
jgi:hypothetical protein